jgi:glutamine cyclotransferase
MNRKRVIIATLAGVVLIAAGVLLAAFYGDNLPGTPNPSSSPSPSSKPTPTQTLSPTPTPTQQKPLIYTYSIVHTYPHDISAFTEGLVFQDGSLFESTGMFAYSSLRRVDLASGEVLQQTVLDSQYFGEGIAVVNDTIVQLTWRNHVGFVYGKDNFTLLRTFIYQTEGWGITFNGTHLIMSDGSPNLYFLDPATFAVVGQVSVRDGKTPIMNINELEYVNGDLYANIWMDAKIAVINPSTGQIKAWIDLSGLHSESNIDDVLNGIAYDQQTGRLFVTGKNWPSLYEIKLVLKS